MSMNYPCYYSSTTLICLMGAVQAIVFGLIVDHNWEHWKLGWNIRLLTVIYSGVFGFGLIVAFQAWCVRIKGPLYVSIFSPFQLILVELAGSFMLNEKLHLGSVLGTMLIVCGLYAVLWGKAKEMKRLKGLVPSLDSVKDPQADETQDSSKNIGVDKDVEKGNAENKINSSTNIGCSGAIELGSLHKEIVVDDYQVKK